MGILVAMAVVAGTLLVAWIVGEIKNVRALRLPGALAPLLLVPVAYYWGSAAGHENAFVESRAHTDELMGAVADALRAGSAKDVIVEAEWLHRCADEPRKRAGSYFYNDTVTAKTRLLEQAALYRGPE